MCFEISQFHHTEQVALKLTDGDSARYIRQLGDSALSLHNNFNTAIYLKALSADQC